jgi:hypothetical protein
VTVAAATLECTTPLDAYNVAVVARFWHSGTDACAGAPHHELNYSGSIVKGEFRSYSPPDSEDQYSISCDENGWRVTVYDLSNNDGGSCHLQAVFLKTSGNSPVGVYTPVGCAGGECFLNNVGSAVGISLVIT